MSAHRRLFTVAGLFVAVTALFYAETSPSLAAPPAPKTSVSEESTTMTVYIGTYTSGNSKGIYQLSLDTLPGQLTQVGVTSGVKNPSFLAIHPSQKYLYAVSEVASVEGKKTGAVSAFAIHPKTGALKSLNWQSTGGGGPCHVVVDHSGQAVLVANYGGGSVASLPIGKHGRLKPAASFIQHKGSSVNPQRQKGPHAHSINVDPKNRFAVAADLGLDKIFVYKFDAGKGTLTPNDPPSTSVAPGYGPRHFAFHPNGRYAYVINEILLTVTAFKWDAEKGVLTELQTIPTVKKVKQGFSTAEVQVHPSGRFLYGSNRGDNSIAIFRIDRRSGKLTAIGRESTRGKTPRNFGIDPTGRFLLAANQSTHNIVVFRIDQKTGQLKSTGHSIEIPNPVCVKFLKP